MMRPSVQEGEKPGPTYSCFINANIKGIDQVFQERTDQPEVQPANTPGAVHQDHDVGNGLSVAHKLVS